MARTPGKGPGYATAPCLKNNMIVLSKLSEKLNNGIKIVVGPVVLESLTKLVKYCFDQ